MKNSSMFPLLPALVIVMGLVLIVGGIVTGKHGAIVVGICAAGAAFYHWQKRGKKESANGG